MKTDPRINRKWAYDIIDRHKAGKDRHLLSVKVMEIAWNAVHQDQRAPLLTEQEKQA